MTKKLYESKEIKKYITTYRNSKIQGEINIPARIGVMASGWG
jgi:NADPH-dependent 7-cyano-7-deazaguanine reductase QueF